MMFPMSPGQPGGVCLSAPGGQAPAWLHAFGDCRLGGVQAFPAPGKHDHHALAMSERTLQTCAGFLAFGVFAGLVPSALFAGLAPLAFSAGLLLWNDAMRRAA